MNCRSVSTFSADAIEQASSIRHRYRRTKRSVIASRYRIRTMCSCPATASWYRSSQRYFRSMTAIRRPSWTIHCFRNRRTFEKRRLHYCGRRMRRAPCGCPSCLMNQGLTINLSARIQARGSEIRPHADIACKARYKPASRSRRSRTADARSSVGTSVPTSADGLTANVIVVSSFTERDALGLPFVLPAPVIQAKSQEMESLEVGLSDLSRRWVREGDELGAVGVACH